MRPKQWEVWYVEAHFEEDTSKSKTRPGIVIVAKSDFAICLKITTQGPRENDYTLEYWKEAGLAEKSYVQLDKKVKVPAHGIYRKVGIIHPEDRLKIEYRLAALL